MTFAAVTLLGMTVGQPLGADYHAMTSRSIRLPIEYKKDRKTIRHVLLYVARNGENTWTQEAFVTPDKDAFVYAAKDDGIYWFKMVIVDVNGTKDPADVTRDPPDLKMVIDTAAPQVRVTNAKRSGEEIVVEWLVEDKFPNDAETKVYFRPADKPTAFWQEVTLPANSRTGVKFPCGTSDGVTVKIAVADVAGNRNEITKDFPAGNGNTTTALSPPATPATAGTGPIVPPPALDPVIPSGPGPVAPAMPPAPPYVPPVQPYTPPLKVDPNLNTGGPQPLGTFDPKAPPPAPPTHTPAGAWSGAAPADAPRAQVINFPRFDLGFDLEQRGPSGISRVDLWVTRNEGKTWQMWSQHDGKGGSVRVVLDVRENAQLEGNYGFRLVPVSGAGLSEREPAAGDAPDMRVTLDVTAPQIELFPPLSDPNAPDTLLLQWKATDRNFGDDPITLEWSENPAGPWKPVVSAANDPVIQATAMNAPALKRLANTGQYGWRVPAGVPARVYLKVTARDAANNVKEVVTREPILVDLTKPRAKISGIVPPPPTIVRP
ncbi:MAG: hypothetical protein FJ304_00615 [Planctomycetes bacterium]|nr:hypothetical protein [Planctomycetota bacterium]